MVFSELDCVLPAYGPDGLPWKHRTGRGVSTRQAVSQKPPKKKTSRTSAARRGATRVRARTAGTSARTAATRTAAKGSAGKPSRH